MESFSRQTNEQTLEGLTGIQALWSSTQSPAAHTLHYRAYQVPLLIKCCFNILRSLAPEALYAVKQQVEHREPDDTSFPGISQYQYRAESGSSSASTNFKAPMDICALEVLRALFAANDASRLRAATTELLRVLSTQKELDHEWIGVIVQTLTEWVPINLRFHVLNTCIDHLRLSIGQQTAETHLSRLIYIIKTLLTSKLSLMGLSVIDVLESLLDMVAVMVHNGQVSAFPSTGKPGIGTQASGPLQSRALDMLLHPEFVSQLSLAIIAVTKRSYYKEQISDIVQTVMHKSVAAKGGPGDMATLKAVYLDIVSKVIGDNSIRQESLNFKSFISPVALLAGVPLLQEQESVRQHYAFILGRYLDVDCRGHQTPSVLWQSDRTLLPLYSRQLQLAIYFYISDHAISGVDLNLIFDVVRNLHHLFEAAELQQFLSMLRTLEPELGSAARDQDKETTQVRSRVSNAISDLSIRLSQIPISSTSATAPPQQSMLIDAWTAKEPAPNTSQAASIIPNQDRRLVSSAPSVRENLEFGASISSLNSSPTGKIANLKDILSQYAYAQNLSTARKIDEIGYIDELFAGIEMLPPHRNSADDDLTITEVPALLSSNELRRSIIESVANPETGNHLGSLGRPIA